MYLIAQQQPILHFPELLHSSIPDHHLLVLAGVLEAEAFGDALLHKIT